MEQHPQLGEWVVEPNTQTEVWVPGNSSSSEYVRHEQLVLSGSLPIVDVFPEWRIEYPLWGGTERTPIAPEDIGISRELGEDLRLWGKDWERLSTVELGWSSQADKAAWEDRGVELVERLKAELLCPAQLQPREAQRDSARLRPQQVVGPDVWPTRT